MGGKAFACHLKRGGRHAASAHRVAPAVVEVEEGAYGHSVENGFVGPASRADGLYIVAGEGGRFQVHFAQIPKQNLFFFRQTGGLQVGEDAGNQVVILKEVRRTCGVAARSEEALVAAGGEGGNQLANPRGQR